MQNERFHKLGPLYGEIAREIAGIAGDGSERVYFYGSAGADWAGGGIFRDEGDIVRYFDPSDALANMLINAWRAEDRDKRWTVIEYQLQGTNFDAWFTFPHQLDPDWNSFRDGREAALIRQFGDKPVIYPPMLSEEDLSA